MKITLPKKILIFLLTAFANQCFAQTNITSLNQPNTAGEFYNQSSITLLPGFSAAPNFSASILNEAPNNDAGDDYTYIVDSLFQHLNKSGITTGILYDRVIPLSGMHGFNKQLPIPALTFILYRPIAKCAVRPITTATG